MTYYRPSHLNWIEIYLCSLAFFGDRSLSVIGIPLVQFRLPSSVMCHSFVKDMESVVLRIYSGGFQILAAFYAVDQLMRCILFVWLCVPFLSSARECVATTKPRPQRMLDGWCCSVTTKTLCGPDGCCAVSNNIFRLFKFSENHIASVT